MEVSRKCFNKMLESSFQLRVRFSFFNVFKNFFWGKRCRRHAANKENYESETSLRLWRTWPFPFVLKWNDMDALENIAFEVKRHWCLENIVLELKRDWCFGEHCFLPHLFEIERILLPNFLSSPMTWSFSFSKRLSFFTCLEGVCTLPLVSFHWALNYWFSKASCFSVTKYTWELALLISMKACELSRMSNMYWEKKRKSGSKKKSKHFSPANEKKPFSKNLKTLLI